MSKRFKVAVVPALMIVIAGMVFTADRASADDFSKFMERAKQGYEKHLGTFQDETIVEEMKTTTAAGEMTTLNTIYRKGGKTRIDSEIKMLGSAVKAGMPDSVVNTVVSDGANYWIITPSAKTRKLSRGEAEQYKGRDYLWSLIPGKAEMAGSEKLGERDCYIVALKQGEDQPKIKVWMDKKTWAIVSVETPNTAGQMTKMVNSDFRKLPDGWEIPYKTKVYMGERLVSTLVVKSVEFDKGLADDLFSLGESGGAGADSVNVKETASKRGWGKG
jgi:outer membrane lipoprotein-sorting protein